MYPLGLDNDVRDACDFCVKGVAFTIPCAGCTKAAYCSFKCQQEHWPTHKYECGKTKPGECFMFCMCSPYSFPIMAKAFIRPLTNLLDRRLCAKMRTNTHFDVHTVILFCLDPAREKCLYLSQDAVVKTIAVFRRCGYDFDHRHDRAEAVFDYIFRSHIRYNAKTSWTLLSQGLFPALYSWKLRDIQPYCTQLAICYIWIVARVCDIGVIPPVAGIVASYVFTKPTLSIIHTELLNVPFYLTRYKKTTSY